MKNLRWDIWERVVIRFTARNSVCAELLCFLWLFLIELEACSGNTPFVIIIPGDFPKRYWPNPWVLATALLKGRRYYSLVNA